MKKGEILVSAKIKNELSNGKKEILCSVQDNGMGIPESSKEHLFQPFYQADSTSTRRHGGSGLGLSISKRLAEMMGGTMWFESEVLGHFYVRYSLFFLKGRKRHYFLFYCHF